MNIHKVFAIGLMLLFLLLLSACGGGGGGGETTSQAPAQPVGVTSGNAEDIARTAISASIAAIDVGENSSSLLSVKKIDSDYQAKKISLTSFALKQLKWLDSTPVSTNNVTYNLVSVISGSVTTDCDNPGAGTATISFVDTDNSSDISTGDSLSITFSSCLISDDQMMLDGGMGMVVSAASGDLDVDEAWSLAISFTFNNFLVSSGGIAESLAGDFVFAVSTTDRVVFSGSVSGSKLAYSYADSSLEELTDFNLGFTSNDATSSYTYDIAGTVAATSINGSFQVTTPTTLFGLGLDYPSSGVMKIKGANNTSMTVEAMSDATTVVLNIDSTGDGIVDDMITTTWDALGV